MKKLLILTSSFPYEGGEQFIGSEIFHWEKSEFDKIILLPISYKGKQRKIPENIDVVGFPASRTDKLRFVILSFFSFLFYKELIYILKSEKKFLLKKIIIALKTVASIFLQKSRIQKQIFCKDEVYIYSYWNDITVYAACLLKRQGKLKKVFSRVHGFDIYEERRLYGYMPLKRQFVQDMDKVYCLSESAIRYYFSRYNIPRKNLEIGRLGVLISDKVPYYYPEQDKLRILSLSHCVPIKRIDKMIVAFKSFAERHAHIHIEWTHIGAGSLLSILQSQARDVESQCTNFKANFLGEKRNIEVLQLLKQQSFDVFVNSSESEGIPVSIMEAMSHGIPAIAPNIGGIADLVREENGYLMSEYASIDEILVGLECFYFSTKAEQYCYRQNARTWVEQNFNADKNYRFFVQKLEELAR